MRPRTLVVAAIVCFTLATCAQLGADTPNAKTLPKGVWMVGVETNRMPIAKLGARDEATGGEFGWVDTEDFAVRNSSKLLGLYQMFGGAANPSNPVDLDTKLAESARFQTTYFDVAYGLTDTWSVMLRVRRIDNKLDYTEDYQRMMENVEAALVAVGANPDLVNIPPDEAKAEGLGDMELGVKYGLSKAFALAFTARTGILKTGDDPKQKKASSDYFEELATGRADDIYTLYGFYDWDYSEKVAFRFLSSLRYFTDGYEKILDHEGEISHGNEYKLMGDVHYRLSDKLAVNPSLTAWYGSKDQMKVNGEWTTVDNSNTSVLYGRVELEYKPAIFLKVFAGYERALYTEVGDGIYEHPGRLANDDLVRVGLTVFFK